MKPRASSQRAPLPCRAPSFRGFKPSSPASSRAKKANRGRDTAHEIELKAALRRLKMRFEAHRSDLLGRPDVVFPKERVAVFCDGDFWHGRNWPELKQALLRRANPAYWVAKIEANRSRDARICRALRQQGWLVIRLWETEIRKDPELAASFLKKRLEDVRTRRGPRQPGQSRAPRKGTAASKIPPAR